MQEVLRLLSEAISELRERVAALERSEIGLTDRDNVIAMDEARSHAWIGAPPTDHFPQDTLATSWTWATSPFVSGAATVEDSVLRLSGLTTSQRAFLYRTTIAPSSKRMRLVLQTQTAAFACGLRMDDGTDNNYVEVRLKVSQASPTQWVVDARARTGGGAIQTQTSDALSYPLAIQLVMPIIGTPWTSWYTKARIRGDFDATMFKPDTAPATGLTWTPTRVGIVLDGGGSAAAEDSAWVDWVRL